jgi:hypothetical protein
MFGNRTDSGDIKNVFVMVAPYGFWRLPYGTDMERNFVML